jgi:hypothetical protein
MDDSNCYSKSLTKLKRLLAYNYYSCLSPPTCQVEEQDKYVHIKAGKGAVRFEVPQKKNKHAAKLEKYHQAKANKQALQASRATQYRKMPWEDMKQAISNILEMTIPPTLRQTKRDKASISERVYVLDYNDDDI